MLFDAILVFLSIWLMEHPGSLIFSSQSQAEYSYPKKP